MKREWLKELGLTDEQIDKIMGENGKDIEKAKGDLSIKETELASVKEKLEKANKQIDDFKDLDVEGIKQAAEDYKIKFEDAERTAKEELERVQFEHTLENALSGAKAKNVKAVKALLNIEGLKLNEGEIVGLNEQLEKLKEENNYLFELEEEKKETTPTFTRPSGGISGGVTKEDLKSMSYKDILELKTNNPETYNSLTKE